MQSKFSNKQGRKLITDDIKIRKFLHNIAAHIKKSITPYLRHEMTYNDIVMKLEQFEEANRGANAERTKPVHPSQVSRYTNATRTRASYSI